MPKKKGGGSDNRLPWLTAKQGGGREPFMMVSVSLFKSAAFASLNYGTRMVYLCMCEHSAGKRSFDFSRGLAEREYGIPRNTLQNAVKELIESGFIERVEDGSYSQFARAVYKFSFDWKKAESAPQNCVNKAAE